MSYDATTDSSKHAAPPGIGSYQASPALAEALRLSKIQYERCALFYNGGATSTQVYQAIMGNAERVDDIYLNLYVKLAADKYKEMLDIALKYQTRLANQLKPNAPTVTTVTRQLRENVFAFKNVPTRVDYALRVSQYQSNVLPVIPQIWSPHDSLEFALGVVTAHFKNLLKFNERYYEPISIYPDLLWITNGTYYDPAVTTQIAIVARTFHLAMKKSFRIFQQFYNKRVIFQSRRGLARRIPRIVFKQLKKELRLAESAANESRFVPHDNNYSKFYWNVGY